MQGTVQSEARSTVGSLGGNVTIVAGEQLHIGGSDVMALRAAGDTEGKTGHIALQGSEVRIDAGEDRSHSVDTAYRKTDSFGVALTGTPLDQELAKPEAERDPIRIAQLKQTVDDTAFWGPGGTGRIALTAVTAAVGGNVTGSTAGMLQAAAVNVLQSLGAQQVKEMADSLMTKDGQPTAGSEAVRAALQGLAACAGAAAQSQSCGAGATGAAASVVLNNLIQSLDGKDAADLTASEKEARVNLVTTLITGITAAAGGDAAVAAAAARIEVENNHLLPDQLAKFALDAKTCTATNSCDRVIRDLGKLNDKQQKELIAACEKDPQACRKDYGFLVDLEKEYSAALDKIRGEGDLPPAAVAALAIQRLSQAEAVDIVLDAGTKQMLQEKLGADARTIDIATALFAAAMGSTKSVKSTSATTNGPITYDSKQLDKKFKHAEDFGVVTTKKNGETVGSFQTAIDQHMNDSLTIPKGTYGFVDNSKVFFNSTTNNVVVVDQKGNFVTAFKLLPGTPQFENYMKNGVLR